MAKFKIVQGDPMKYKEDIIGFWQEHLPGTPPGRLEWMGNGNPAGKTMWFFALEEKSNRLAGTISIFPKEMSLNGKTIKVGILGDLMVRAEYRVFGPMLSLVRHASDSSQKFGLEFVYTLPNENAKKVIERVGFLPVGALTRFVRPISLTPYLEKFVSRSVAKAIAPLAAKGLRLLSRGTSLSGRGYMKELQKPDPYSDVLWNRIKSSYRGLVGERKVDYLDWRYFRSPLRPFRLIVYYQEKDVDLQGYVFYSTSEGDLEIWDLVASSDSVSKSLLMQMISIAMKERCRGLIVNVSNKAAWSSLLRQCMFFEARDSMEFWATGNQEMISGGLDLMNGDRNI